MTHDISVAGYGIVLRPVRFEDAEFIVNLRQMSHAQGMIGDTSDVAAQRRWLEIYSERPDDYYFIIESASGQRVGTIGLYDFRDEGAEVGRWVILPGIMAALPSMVLAHEIAFNRLNLKELRGNTVRENHRVLSFHRRFGSKQTGVELQCRRIGGKLVDLVWFKTTREDWPEMDKRLKPLCEVAGRAIFATTLDQRH